MKYSEYSSSRAARAEIASEHAYEICEGEPEDDGDAVELEDGDEQAEVEYVEALVASR